MTEYVHLEGMPEVKAMLSQYHGQKLQNKMRKAVRAGAKPFQATLKAAAASEPSGNVPKSFQRVLAPKVSTRGGASGREIYAYVRPKSPLFNILEPGARPHQIVPGLSGANSYRPSRPYPTAPKLGPSRGALGLGGPAGGSTWTAAGRKRPRAMFSSKPVRHPGLKSRAIMPTAFRAGVPAAQKAIADAIFAMTAPAGAPPRDLTADIAASIGRTVH